MPRTAAVITQADVARCVRAAKQAGASAVEVLPDGRIVIRLHEQEAEAATWNALTPKNGLEDEREIIL